MKTVLQMFSLFVLTACLLGCGDGRPQESSQESSAANNLKQIEKQTARLKERIEKLEVKQIKLADQVEDLREREPVAISGSETNLEEVIADQVENVFNEYGEQRVAAIALEEIRDYEEEQKEARQAEIEEQRLQREARRQEREAERLARMTDELGLNAQQAEELEIARAGLRKTMREVFNYMREQGGFDAVIARNTITELREEHRNILLEFMTEEQVDAYMEEYTFGPFRSQ